MTSARRRRTADLTRNVGPAPANPQTVNRFRDLPDHGPPYPDTPVTAPLRPMALASPAAVDFWPTARRRATNSGQHAIILRDAVNSAVLRG